MKRKFSILIVLSIIQAVTALSLLIFPSSTQAVNAYAWCNGSCGGCGIMGVEFGGCWAIQCSSCGCSGSSHGDYIEWSDSCPGLHVE
jgi:hypothetical protein